MTAGGRRWCALCALFAVLAVTAGFAPHESLDWQPARAAGEPWRAWSAAFVHLSRWHLIANLAGCAVVAAFGAAARVPRWASWAWLGAWPLLHVALALKPALASYGGLSGLLHAGVAVAAWSLLRDAQRRRRAIGLAVLIGLAVKVLTEAPWGPPTQALRGWNFAVAPLAHATGAIAGLLCALAAERIVAWRAR